MATPAKRWRRAGQVGVGVRAWGLGRGWRASALCGGSGAGCGRVVAASVGVWCVSGGGGVVGLWRQAWRVAMCTGGAMCGVCVWAGRGCVSHQDPPHSSNGRRRYVVQ